MRSWHFNHIDFSSYPHYNGDDQGVFWSPTETRFTLWAPTAVKVELRLYLNGENSKPERSVMLNPGKQGIWSLTIKENLHNWFYTFRVNDGEWLQEVPDPYAKAVGVNGQRGMIVNLEATHPEGWKDDKGPSLVEYTDAIIYEVHIRDFSISENSGMKNKGLYLAFTEEGTVSPLGEKTGIDHLSELGITHVHLLPVADFQSVDEEKPLARYNWGYDPQNFNVPEGSYASDPYDGAVRIREFKQLVQRLHQRGIGVVLDVVYNHTGLTKGSVFNQTVPGYFYRQNPDGSFSNASGCGNELATERSMVRKFILDSLRYWIREYHIDGFRFDLLGIYDLDTVREIIAETRKEHPGILLYGEGWAADWSPMPENKRAVKQNIRNLEGMAVFNDDLRDALKGDHSHRNSRGFVSQLPLREEAVKFGVVGAIYHPQIVYSYVESSHEPWANHPVQCVNYVSCHDNYTLFDKLTMSVDGADSSLIRMMVKLAGAIVLTSQGIPFLHAGDEFCRTKNGHGNSYNASDAINRIDWIGKSVYRDVFDYYRKLIAIRRNHPLFRRFTADQVREQLNFCIQYQVGVVSYCINNLQNDDCWQRVIVVFNGNNHSVNVPLPEGQFLVIAEGDTIDETGIRELEKEYAEVASVSMLMLAQPRQTD